MRRKRTQFTRAFVFASYAGTDLERWQEAVGQDVVHYRFGRGRISRVRLGFAGDIIVSVRFASGNREERDLAASVFMDSRYILDCTIPDDTVDLVPVSSFKKQVDFIGHSIICRKPHLDGSVRVSETDPA